MRSEKGKAKRCFASQQLGRACAVKSRDKADRESSGGNEYQTKIIASFRVLSHCIESVKGRVSKTNKEEV